MGKKNTKYYEVLRAIPMPNKSSESFLLRLTDGKGNVLSSGDIIDVSVFSESTIASYLAKKYIKELSEFEVKEKQKSRAAEIEQRSKMLLISLPAQKKENFRKEKDEFEKQKKAFEKKNPVFVKEKEALNQEKEALNQEKEALNQEKEALNQEKEALNQEKEALNQEKEALNQE